MHQTCEPSVSQTVHVYQQLSSRDRQALVKLALLVRPYGTGRLK